MNRGIHCKSETSFMGLGVNAGISISNEERQKIPHSSFIINNEKCKKKKIFFNTSYNVLLGLYYFGYFHNRSTYPPKTGRFSVNLHRIDRQIIILMKQPTYCNQTTKCLLLGHAFVMLYWYACHPSLSLKTWTHIFLVVMTKAYICWWS